MKTNKITKIILALAAVVILCSLAITAYAETGTQQAVGSDASKKGPKDHKGRPMKHDDDWFEDWFEDRIEAREDEVDFSEFPENPTKEDFVEFFVKNFIHAEDLQKDAGETDENAKKDRDLKEEGKPSRKHHSKDGSAPSHTGKHGHRDGDRFEDWFEDLIEAREDEVDFSELPEDPTDEEIIEFFKKYFMDGDAAENDNGTKDAPEAQEPDLSAGSDTADLPENTADVPAETQPEDEPGKDAA